MTPAEVAAHKAKVDAVNGRVRAIVAQSQAKLKLTTKKQCYDHCYGKYGDGIAYYCYYHSLRCPTLP